MNVMRSLTKFPVIYPCVSEKKRNMQYVIQGDAFAGNDQLVALNFFGIIVKRTLTSGMCFRGLLSAAS